MIAILLVGKATVACVAGAAVAGAVAVGVGRGVAGAPGRGCCATAVVASATRIRIGKREFLIMIVEGPPAWRPRAKLNLNVQLRTRWRCRCRRRWRCNRSSRRVLAVEIIDECTRDIDAVSGVSKGNAAAVDNHGNPT